MKVPVGITTAKRPNNDYLSGLLDDMGGEIDRVLIAPTMPGDIPDRFAVVRRLEPLLPDATMNAVERNEARCLERNTDRLMQALAESPFFVTLQDDVKAVQRVWERVDQCATWMAKNPRVAYVSFYTPYSEVTHFTHKSRAVWPYPAAKFYGELAMLWNAKAAVHFLSWGRDPAVAHDLQIQQFFARTNWYTYAHCPCLFQHVGVESATAKGWDAGQRVSMNFRPALNIDSLPVFP